MRRLVIALILVACLLVPITSTAIAQPPNTENWTLGYLRDGTGEVWAGYYINTTNLKVETFWMDNQSGSDRIMIIKEHGEITWTMLSPAWSGYTEKENLGFKFRRKPLDDPDQPEDIRYMPNTEIGVQYP
jgi:hypothetical protein